MTKSIEDSFRDWESNVFGFGYGSGEEHTLAALKTFLATVGEGEPEDRARCYDYKKLEAACGPQVAWLLINTLAHHRADMFNYGTSPRFGWLEPTGERLKAFVVGKTVDELVAICCEGDENYNVCYPDACNCGEGGYEKGRKCLNPFWECK